MNRIEDNLNQINNLGKVLNMSPIKTITFVELNKYLAHHFTPVAPVVSA